ncbi:hypothetical protein ABTX35_38675, partial [Streptomyces sp. NPDC096080]|uniref:hypothetical protein n=1 Tax=Streptomyces sp. NPDC096080 TaxID=3156693 RepID=UPI00331BF960
MARLDDGGSIGGEGLEHFLGAGVGVLLASDQGEGAFLDGAVDSRPTHPVSQLPNALLAASTGVRGGIPVVP